MADYITCKVFYTLAQQATIQILNFPCVFEVKCWISGHYMQWRARAMRARAMEILRLASDFHSLCYRLGISYAKPNGIGFARDSHKHINTPFRCCTMRDDFDLHFPQNYTFRNVTNTMCIVYCVWLTDMLCLRRTNHIDGNEINHFHTRPCMYSLHTYNK